MRKSLFGVLAAFAIGCGGPSVSVSGSAIDSEPPNPDPPWCSACPDRNLRTPLKTPVFDPLQLAGDYGRPELAPEIARRAQLLTGKLTQVTTVAQADALITAFTAELDLLAQ